MGESGEHIPSRGNGNFAELIRCSEQRLAETDEQHKQLTIYGLGGLSVASETAASDTFSQHATQA